MSEHWENHLHSFTCPFILEPYSFELILITLPPPHSRGPSGQNITTSHVRVATTRTVVSQSQVPQSKFPQLEKHENNPHLDNE